jgi:hypothetical protein
VSGERLAAILALTLAACSSEERSHIYAGRLYEADRACLDSVTSIDVVDGPLPETPCAPLCVVAPVTDAAQPAVYISTMCAPFPPAFDTSGTDSRCARALATYTQNATCLADGGIANAFPPDASTD